jgi:hypothetical protein
MALSDVETALGRLVRAADGNHPFRRLHLDTGELACLEGLRTTAGFRFTVGVQRSWCLARAARAGSLTLSILPETFRSQLLEEWIEAGGGASSFVGAEAEALLDFIAKRLPDPSHELTACRFEQATLRAKEAAEVFEAPDASVLDAAGCAVRRGRSAGMAVFYGEPDAIIRALVAHAPLPPVMEEGTAMLSAPGFEGLCRAASLDECAVWQRLERPVLVEELRGYDLAVMLRAGAVETV